MTPAEAAHARSAIARLKAIEAECRHRVEMLEDGPANPQAKKIAWAWFNAIFARHHLESMLAVGPHFQRPHEEAP